MVCDCGIGFVIVLFVFCSNLFYVLFGVVLCIGLLVEGVCVLVFLWWVFDFVFGIDLCSCWMIYCSCFLIVCLILLLLLDVVC